MVSTWFHCDRAMPFSQPLPSRANAPCIHSATDSHTLVFDIFSDTCRSLSLRWLNASCTALVSVCINRSSRGNIPGKRLLRRCSLHLLRMHMSEQAASNDCLERQVWVLTGLQRTRTSLNASLCRFSRSSPPMRTRGTIMKKRTC